MYSLGVVLTELLTGERPTGGERRSHHRGRAGDRAGARHRSERSSPGCSRSARRAARGRDRRRRSCPSAARRGRARSRAAHRVAADRGVGDDHRRFRRSLRHRTRDGTRGHLGAPGGRSPGGAGAVVTPPPRTGDAPVVTKRRFRRAKTTYPKVAKAPKPVKPMKPPKPKRGARKAAAVAAAPRLAAAPRPSGRAPGSSGTGWSSWPRRCSSSPVGSSRTPSSPRAARCSPVPDVTDRDVFVRDRGSCTTPASKWRRPPRTARAPAAPSSTNDRPRADARRGLDRDGAGLEDRRDRARRQHDGRRVRPRSSCGRSGSRTSPSRPTTATTSIRARS